MTASNQKLRRGIPAPTGFHTPEGTLRRIYGKTMYTAELGQRVCELLMQGKSLKEIAAEPRMPSKRTIIRWLADPKMGDFREMYYYSRRVQAEIRVDEILEIADDTSKDWEKVYNKDGELIDLKPNNEAIQRSRVRIDTRKWIASKLVPRIYGDTVNHELDVTGDLAELLKKASNRDQGLPKPINGEAAKGITENDE